jgi:DNA mismatch endonuclease (patch repair protein)
MPNSNTLYWNKKIEKNRIRDKAAVYQLKQNGWRVLRIWEHSLTVKKIVPKIKNIKELL